MRAYFEVCKNTRLLPSSVIQLSHTETFKFMDEANSNIDSQSQSVSLWFDFNILLCVFLSRIAVRFYHQLWETWKMCV